MDIFKIQFDLDRIITLENIINYNDTLIYHISRELNADFAHIYNNWENSKSPTPIGIIWNPIERLFPISPIIFYNYKNKLSIREKNNFNIKFFNIINGHIKGNLNSIYFINAYKAIFLNYYISSLLKEDILQKINTFKYHMPYPLNDKQVFINFLENFNLYSTYKSASISWEFLKFYDQQLKIILHGMGLIRPTKNIINVINRYHLENIICQLYIIKNYPHLLRIYQIGKEL